ncbi:MAG TPA: cytochrome C [Bacteroidales bacterium]|nr:cytochrome C [Bacteroidales bacterium]
MKKILLFIGLGLVIIIAGLLSFVKFALPNVGEPEEISAEITDAQLERGAYLANSVAVCMDCHSTRDWNLFSGPLKPGTLGMGGEKFGEELGFPGNFYAKNITPYALKDWTDGEILRAIASGVNKTGEPLFPVMPHPNYGKMDKEDLLAIIAYLRSLEPLENEVKKSEATFPMNFILNLIPKKPNYTTKPTAEDKLAYGEYLFNTASCTDCHTKQIKGKPVEGMHLAGGFEFPLFSGGKVVSSNITPDKETGIGNWTEQDFVNKFKLYADSTYVPQQVKAGEFNTVMPWTMYGTMKEEDLKAIYTYLRTVKPINNKVVKFSAN